MSGDYKTGDYLRGVETVQRPKVSLAHGTGADNSCSGAQAHQLLATSFFM